MGDKRIFFVDDLSSINFSGIFSGNLHLFCYNPILLTTYPKEGILLVHKEIVL